MQQVSSKKLTAILPLVFLSACGGGGGGGGSNDDESNSPSNRAPEFVSASELTLEENSTGTVLTLSASDADGDSISFSIKGGEDRSRFLIDNGDQLRFGFTPDFENPTDSDGDNIYRVTIEASDGKGGNATQAIAITIIGINDGAPEFSSPAEVTVEEGVSGVFYTALAQDPDRDDVTYSLSGGADSALFSIDSTSGELRFNLAPDFELPADSDEDNFYQLAISAADSEGAANQLSLQVAVTNVATPSARIDFPTGGANMGGKLSSLALTTRVFDLESGENSSEQLVSLSVDGQSPSQDAITPSLWYLNSTINEGSDTYALSAQFATGETVDDTRSVKNEQLIGWPVGVSYDNFYRTFYFADTGLDTIFEVNSSRRVISGPAVGSGPTLDPIDMEQNFPEGRSDPANDYFVVLNKDGSIYSVQRSTGDRTQLTTWIPADLKALTLTSSGGEAYTTRAVGPYGEIVKFNLSSGDYSVISSSNSSSPTGTGPDIVYPAGIALDEESGQLYVGDISTQSILKVDIASGDRTTISGNGVGSGEPVTQPMDLIVDIESGHVYIANGSGQNILQVDIGTGNRSVVTDWNKGEGPQLDNPWSISESADSDRLLVSGVLTHPVVMSVDTSTGNRAEISSNHVGEGPSYTWNDVSYSSSADRLLVVSQSQNAAAEIDLNTGNRKIVSYFDPGASPRLVASTIVAADSDRHAYIFDEYSDRLAKVDLASGELQIISSSGIGEGPAFPGLVKAMQLDATNNRVVLLHTSGLMTVDLDSGDREIIFDNNTGSAPFFESVNGLALDLAHTRAFVSDDGTGGIWQVDLTTGDRSTFTSSIHGGTAEQSPRDLVLDTLGNRLLVGTASGNLVAIDLDDFSQSTLSDGSDCDGASPSDCNGVSVAAYGSMTIDRGGNRLFAYGSGLNGLAGVIVVDLRSGQRALASQ